MFRDLLNRWADWTGDASLTRAIHGELRRLKYAATTAKTRDVRLIAIQRPGWVQVRQFLVETRDAEKNSVTLLGLARDDGRKSRIEILLTTSRSSFISQRTAWSEGLIVTRRRD